MLEQDKFRLSREQEERAKDKRKIFTVSLNDKEIEGLKRDMKLLNQTKPSTALKQLAKIGSYVLHRDKIGFLITVIRDNQRRNKKTGIIDPNPEIEANVNKI
jgi:hypothetical protein